jgi:hypothetical protein
MKPGEDHPVSHGICAECLPGWLRRSGMPEDEIEQAIKEIEEEMKND